MSIINFAQTCYAIESFLCLFDELDMVGIACEINLIKYKLVRGKFNFGPYVKTMIDPRISLTLQLHCYLLPVNQNLNAKLKLARNMIKHHSL